MFIALIIVGGLTAMTAIAVAGDYLTKTALLILNQPSFNNA